MELSIIIAFIVGCLVGACGAYYWYRSMMRARQKIEQEAQQHSQKTFNEMATQALVQNNENFITIAKETLEKQYAQSAANLQQRESSIQNLVKPIQETLEKTKQQIQDIEKERHGSYKALDQSINDAIKIQQDLSKVTTRLEHALTQPTVSGHWGEMTLHRLAELAGLSEHCDFSEQSTIDTDQGNRLRPDMIVHLPNQRNIVIDAKTPLRAYLEACNTEQHTERVELFEKHANNIYTQVKELAKKSYAENIRDTLDFVILFLPGDQFLTQALKHRPTLIEQAMEEQIVITTPGSLIALLRAVAYGWREKSMSDNAEKIQTLSEEFFERLNKFLGYFQDVGKQLGQSINKYNQAVGSFDSRLMPKLQELNKFKINRDKEINRPHTIEQKTRTFINQALPPQDKDQD